MKTLFTILAIASLASLSSCDLFDNEPELPPITTEGKGTFGCYVNGNLFLPEAPSGYGNGIRAELFKNSTLTSVNIYAGNSSTKQTFIIAILDNSGIADRA